MDKLYFSLYEFIRRPDLPLPHDVADKIVQYHLWVLNPVRASLGAALIVSQRSGYRPVQHEKDKGRSGDSQHTFQSKGAVDLTCNETDLPNLARLLSERTNYTRITWYPDKRFFHCDYKYSERGQRKFVSVESWQQVREKEFIQSVQNEISLGI